MRMTTSLGTCLSLRRAFSCLTSRLKSQVPRVLLSRLRQSPPPPITDPVPTPILPAARRSPHVVHQFAPSLLTRTENNSATFSSSNDACVDFFFQIVPDTPQSKTVFLLQQAWQQDPLTALQLVFHLRAVRSSGKADQAGFYPCMSWLHHHHPLTLLENLYLVPKFGCYKDLPEIVRREVEGTEETEKRLAESAEHNLKVAQQKARRSLSERRGCGRRHEALAARISDGYWARKGRAAKEAAKNGTLQDRKTRIAASLARDKAAKEAASVLRKEKRAAMASRASKRYAESESLASLCDAVARVFALQLIEDKKALESEDFFGISLAAKWCPSYQKSCDLRTQLNSKIAYRLYGEIEMQPVLLDEQAVTDKLRREYLAPLRQAKKMPEVYMCANKWDTLPYENVPSVAMRRYVELFRKHDYFRFTRFLEQVKLGKKKVAAGALLPHEILQAAVMGRSGTMEGELAEAQWNRMVQDLKGSGSRLTSSLAVCDVSGSMFGLPIDVCIALGMLVAELSEEPWKNCVCTFSMTPQIHSLKGKTLADRYDFTKLMHWDMNTDFLRVFRLLLDMAQETKLPKEKMIKRLFVFSDMEFDQASLNPWETDYMKITEMYAQAGYGEPPEIVFWNLRDSWSTPVLSNQQGVALVSGFSKNLLKIFLEEDSKPLEVSTDSEQNDREPANPKEVMMRALAGELFQELKVVD